MTAAPAIVPPPSARPPRPAAGGGPAASGRKLPLVPAVGALAAAILGLTPATAAEPPVKLVFIHHSCGENLLADANGGLGAALAKAGYFVSDTNYGWGPGGIGDRTDIPNWPEWFCGSTDVLAALFRESETRAPYTRPLPDPGGENRVVIFKSCFPNSELEGQPADAPNRDCDLTVGGAKGIYLQLRQAFLARPDKFFMVVTAPPVSGKRCAKNARAFNTWLVRDWLQGYPGQNVAVFDFFTVLTGKNNHHRIRDGKVEYINDTGGDTLAYPSADDHPSAAGNRKATGEFVPFLDFHLRRWLATKPAAAPPTAARPAPPPATITPGPVEQAQAPAQAQAPSPPPPPPTRIAAGTASAADFAASAAGWEIFQDEAVPTPMMKVAPGAAAGTRHLAVTYRINANSWAACAKTEPHPVDWRAYAGLTVRYQTPRGCRLVLVAYEDGPEQSLLHFEFPLPEGTGSWQDATISWRQFRQPEWQGDSSRPFAADRARGVAFILHPDDAPIQGEFRIAGVKLATK